jgi:chemotaxis family two-component system response regulator Rcp1
MPFEILLVDDNAADVRLLQEAFREVDESLHLHVANDGVEALAFLEQEGDHSQAPRPDLILLDLNMPKMDGREVLLVELEAGEADQATACRCANA